MEELSMVWLRRLVGLLGVLLGTAGIVACLAGIVSVWSIRSRVDDGAAEASARVDDVLARVEDRANKVTDTIQSAQDSARDLNQRVQQRVSELRDVPLEEAADIDELERQLYARIQLAGDWIGFIQSTMDLVEQLVGIVESASLFAQKESHTMADVIGAIRDGKEEIRHTSEMVDDIKISLAEIRSHSDVDENAKQIRTLSSTIDTSLAKTRRYAEAFQRAVAEARADIAGLATRIRRQTLIAAVLLTVILVWIAIAQLSLAVHGWRALRLRAPGSE
jgi:methyl-accepting chemotaxis protein